MLTYDDALNEDLDTVLPSLNSLNLIGTLLVFLFHGVGGSHNINFSLEAHRQLIYFLKQHESDFWNVTMVDIAR